MLPEQVPNRNGVAAPTIVRMFRPMTTSAFRWTMARVLIAACMCLVPARVGLHAQAADRVSPRVRSAVAALPPGRALPVIVEFEAAPEPTPAEPGDGGLVRRLRSRATLALRGLDEGPVDEAVRVTERFWVVPAAAAEVTAAGLERLTATPGVRRVVSDEPLPVILEPRSSSFAPPTYTSDAMRTIGADAVWDGGNTGAGTVIAFFDSGVDAANAMVSRRWRGHRTSVRASWFDPFRRSSEPQDLIGHGTQVAAAAVGALGAGDVLELADGSTLVASSNLDVVTGPAPEAEWIAARVFDNFGNGVYTRRSILLQAFQWALDPDGNEGTDDAPDVINNSWGILPTSDFDLCTDVLYDAIDAAEAAGIAVLFSAGNSGPGAGTIAFPAARDDAQLRSFAVGSSSGTTTIAVASYSSRGPSPCGGEIKPEIIAPGTVPEVRAAGEGRARLTGFTVQGTSFSTAQAAGALALLRQVRGGAAPETLKRFLRDQAVDVGVPGPDDEAGYGLLDVPAALGAAGAQVRPRLQVAGATAGDDGLIVLLRNRGGVAWPGGAMRVEPVMVGGPAPASARLPAIAAGNEIAARLAWSEAPPADGVSIRVTVTGEAGETVLSRVVLAGPPDGFGGFVLTAGDLSAGANDFGRLGRIAAVQGFQWQGAELLPAAGLAVAAGGRVSDAFYVSTLGRFDLKTFAPAVETDWAPQRSLTDAQATEADVRFDDFEALLPVGLEVTGHYEASDVDGVGALGLVLTVRNRSGQAYGDVTAGLLADWDLAGGEHVRWAPGIEALITEPITAGGPITFVASDTTVRASVELPLGTPGTGSFYQVDSGVLVDSLVDDTKLDLLQGGSAASLPGAGMATDNAALLGVGPFDVAAGASVTVRFWLMAAPDEASAATRLAELRAEAVPPPSGDGDEFAALPPYPNPLRVGQGIVRFPYTVSDAQLDSGGDVALEIYDLAGRRLVRQAASLASGGTLPEFTWDGRLGGGTEAASGMYMYVIRLGDRTVSGRVLIQR